jgi:hypothetical protein
MKLKIFGLVAIVACLHTVAATADYWKLSFDPDPLSFTEHLNQIKWLDGKTRFFSNVGGCRRNNLGDTYSCSYGTVEITDSVGDTQLCELQSDSFEGVAVGWYQGARLGTPHRCRSSD